MAGLETTAHAPQLEGLDVLEELEELETTAHAPKLEGLDVLEELEELETTAHAPELEGLDVLEELETTAHAPVPYIHTVHHSSAYTTACQGLF